MSPEITYPGKHFPDDVLIVEGKEYKQGKPREILKWRASRRAKADLEALYAERCTFDLYEIKQMYIEGRPLAWISENACWDIVTCKPVSVKAITGLAKRYNWTTSRRIYKELSELKDKEWLDKFAKLKAEAYEIGRQAGKAEQIAFYEKTHTEKMLDSAEQKAQEMMDAGDVKGALEVTYQIERLRKASKQAAAIQKDKYTPQDTVDSGEEDETMRLLDSAVEEVKAHAQ